MSDNETVELRDGFRMPLVGFGTYLLSGQSCVDSVREALRVGYRHIDTAEFYANEREVGLALKESGIPRENIYVVTKLAPGGFGVPFRNFETTLQAFEDSFQKLDAGYIDLYLIHHGFAKTERLNQWRALLKLQEEGKVRSIGVSNWGINHINEIKSAGLPLPVVNQIEIHPLCTQEPLISYLTENQILPVAYSSLAPLSSWRLDTPEKSSKVDVLNTEIIAGISHSHNVSESRVLLRWGIQHGYPVIPKSTHPERIRENFELFNFSLSEEELIKLDSMNKDRCFAWPTCNPINCD